LPLNRELVTIKTDVALEQPARALSLRERDVATLRELYTRYGFNQALRELEGNAAPEPAPARPRCAPPRPDMRASHRRLRPLLPILRCPRRASTRWSCPAIASTPGSGSSRLRRNSPSTPRPIRWTRCARAWSA